MILSIYLIVSCFSLIVIIKDGLSTRLPDLLKKQKFQFSPQPYLLLKDDKKIPCLDKSSDCTFNTNSKKKLYLIGNSQMISLSYGLKKLIIDLDYQFIVKNIDTNCFFSDDFISCNDFINFFDQENINNSIIIIGGNEIYKIDSLNENRRNVFIKNLKKISTTNHIILVYPIPNPKIDVPASLFKLLSKNKNLELKNYVTSSFLEYKSDTVLIFDLLDSVKNKNILRVYPHELFCNKTIPNRCLTHDNENIFYSDNVHLSLKGAEMVNNLIISEMYKIK